MQVLYGDNITEATEKNNVPVIFFLKHSTGPLNMLAYILGEGKRQVSVNGVLVSTSRNTQYNVKAN